MVAVVGEAGSRLRVLHQGQRLEFMVRGIGNCTGPSDGPRRNRRVVRRIGNGSVEPYSLSSLVVGSLIRLLRWTTLCSTIRRRLLGCSPHSRQPPFEVELAPSLIEYLQAENVADADRMHHVVWDLSYAGDEGGIICHLSRSEETGRALVVSLTHVRVPRSMPLAAAVLDYQKHRVKKLKKQGRR